MKHLKAMAKMKEVKRVEKAYFWIPFSPEPVKKG